MGDKFAICGHICYSKLDLADMPIDQVAIKLHVTNFIGFSHKLETEL